MTIGRLSLAVPVPMRDIRHIANMLCRERVGHGHLPLLRVGLYSESFLHTLEHKNIRCRARCRTRRIFNTPLLHLEVRDIRSIESTIG